MNRRRVHVPLSRGEMSEGDLSVLILDALNHIHIEYTNVIESPQWIVLDEVQTYFDDPFGRVPVTFHLAMVDFRLNWIQGVLNGR
jgi:hypothetical protein